MALQSTYIGITPRTAVCGATALARGVRVSNTAGVAAVADHTTRGEFVTLTSIEALKPGEVASMQGGGKVPALASEACAVDDPAYSADNGKFQKTAQSGAILVGEWSQAASGDGVLGEVELYNPA